MARTAYDVDRRTRHLDLHKQFSGGLKTIDTDDALRSVYLRKMNNLSLSEFGFIEKRYGIYKNDEFQFVDKAGVPIFPFSIQGNPGLVQGYFEYSLPNNAGLDKIVFIDGTAYIKQHSQNAFKRIELISKEEGFDYPDDQFINLLPGDYSIGDFSFIIKAFIDYNITKAEDDTFVTNLDLKALVDINPQITKMEYTIYNTSISLTAIAGINPNVFKLEGLKLLAISSISPSITKMEYTIYEDSFSTSGVTNIDYIITKLEDEALEQNSLLTLSASITPSITKVEEEPTPSAPTNVTVDTSDNLCLYHEINITNSNSFGVMAQVRKNESGYNWKNVGTMGGNTSSTFALEDQTSGPFATRGYEVRFYNTADSTKISSDTEYSVTNASCSFGGTYPSPPTRLDN